MESEAAVGDDELDGVVLVLLKLPDVEPAAASLALPEIAVELLLVLLNAVLLFCVLCAELL